MASTGSVHGTALRGLLHAAVTGDGDAMSDLVTEDVVGWSPNLLVRSRAELLDAVGPRDDTFSGSRSTSGPSTSWGTRPSPSGTWPPITRARCSSTTTW
jgi:hypothetical protein